MGSSSNFAKLYSTEELGQVLVVLERVSGNPAVTIKYSDPALGRGVRNIIFIGDDGAEAAKEYFNKMTILSAVRQALLAIKSNILEVNVK